LILSSIIYRKLKSSRFLEASIQTNKKEITLTSLNNCIKQLAKQRIFPRKIFAACDATLYETTDKFKGCGSVSKKVKVKARGYRKNGELKEGVYVQAYMTMAIKALTTAFLKWQKDQSKLEARRKPSTWQMYRQKLKVQNRNKLIVFVGNHFGIFPSHEVFIFANVPVHQLEEELDITRDSVYAKYCTKP